MCDTNARPTDTTATERTTLRLPRALLDVVAERARAAGLSWNAYALRALEAAVAGGVTATPALAVRDTTETPQPDTTTTPARAPVVSPLAFAAALVRVHAAALASDPAAVERALAAARELAGQDPEACAALAEAPWRVARPVAPAGRALTQGGVRERYKALMARRDGGRKRAGAALEGMPGGSVTSLDRFAAGGELPPEALAALAGFLDREG